MRSKECRVYTKNRYKALEIKKRAPNSVGFYEEEKMQTPNITDNTNELDPETMDTCDAHNAASSEVTPSLEEIIRATKLKAEEHHDAWLRAKAETENVRRRAQEDLSKATKYAVEKFAAELLAVKDSLEAALCAENPNVETFKTGSELTLKQLIAVFEKSGVRELNPLHEKFDPRHHQAISVVDSEQAPNTVLTVLQKGYLLADRVLRPALVIVSKSDAWKTMKRPHLWGVKHSKKHNKQLFNYSTI